MLSNTLHNLERAFVKTVRSNVDSQIPPNTNDSAIFNYLKLKHIF